MASSARTTNSLVFAVDSVTSVAAGAADDNDDDAAAFGGKCGCGCGW